MKIIIEDNALPILNTSAIEAYTEDDSRVFELTEGVTLDASSLTTRMIQNN